MRELNSGELCRVTGGSQTPQYRFDPEALNLIVVRGLTGRRGPLYLIPIPAPIGPPTAPAADRERC